MEEREKKERRIHDSLNEHVIATNKTFNHNKTDKREKKKCRFWIYHQNLARRLQGLIKREKKKKLLSDIKWSKIDLD